MLRSIILTGVCMLLAACTANYQLIGSFDHYKEVFRGDVDANLISGTANIVAKGEETGMTCRGAAHVTYIPPYSLSCSGQRGVARLTCDDGRVISVRYDVDTCTSGSGYGHDDRGDTFTFVFGLDEAEADRRLAELRPTVARKPELPVYRPKEVRAEKGFSTGTVFFVTSQGHGLTNFHVIEDSKDVSVRLEGGKSYPAEVVATDPANDVALIKVAAETKPLPLAKSVGVEKGSDVLVLGYPLINIQGQSQKATFGRINALSGIQDDIRFFQIDVPIQPGNSGGPLIDGKGNVVGIVTATLNQIVALRSSGALPQNVNYAVKSAYVLPLLESKVSQELIVTPNEAVGNMPGIVRNSEISVGLVIAK